MPENVVKMARSASPVARAGAGDISERELSRERYTLQTTPPARLLPVHPKKKLFLTPVSKFTASQPSSPNIARLRSCLEHLQSPKPRMTPKAASMEDLTPTKRMKMDNSPVKAGAARVSRAGAGAGEAAARVARFMVVSAWRRRRDEVRCLRRTLETQVSCSERLRMQVSALRSLLDSDNAKVRLAMKELDRLKQLLKDKEKEKAVLEKEKLALENDVCAAEDRASEMGIGWRNCRNELDVARAAAAAAQASARHRAAELARERDGLYQKLIEAEEEVVNQEELRQLAEEEAGEARAAAERARADAERRAGRLRDAQRRSQELVTECTAVQALVTKSEQRESEQREEIEALRKELGEAKETLRVIEERQRWLPEKIASVVWWARELRPALLWSAAPACSHRPPPWLM